MRLAPAYARGRCSGESELTCGRSNGRKLAVGARAGAELPAIRRSSRSKAPSMSMRPARVRASVHGADLTISVADKSAGMLRDPMLPAGWPVSFPQHTKRLLQGTDGRCVKQHQDLLYSMT